MVFVVDSYGDDQRSTALTPDCGSPSACELAFWSLLALSALSALARLQGFCEAVVERVVRLFCLAGPRDV